MKNSRLARRSVRLLAQTLEDRNAPAIFGPIDNTVNVGTQPQSIAVEDFDGDGIQDLAVANVNGNELTILLGDGSGGFSSAAGSPIAINRPYFVASGDFNGDGLPDLAVANNFGAGGTVTVLLGNGSGGFSQGTSVASSTVVSVAVGDFNGDGKKDLAATNNISSGTVTVLLGNGDGSFNSAVGSPFAAGDGPRSVAVGDLNGDGKQDLAVTNFGSNNVTVLLGTGSGGFNPAVGSPIAVGTNPNFLAVGDFNGDGTADLAIPNSGSNNVTILLGNVSGALSSAPGSPFAVGSGPTSVAVGDLNGDGKQDLAVTNYGSTNFAVLMGTGDGSFSPSGSSPVATGTGPYFVASGEFNGDSKPDLAVANYISNNLTIYLNHGGFRITESGSTVVSENGLTDTYTIMLNGQPSSDVTVNINADSQLSTNPTSVTFTSANWNVPQTVTLSVIDDFIAQGDLTAIITHSVVSADPDFNGINVASVTVTILDNDHAGVTVNVGVGIAVTEGGATDTYTVSLTSQPTADVLISISPDSQLTTAPTMLTFTPADWNVAQTVTVTAVDDAVPEGLHTGIIAHSASSLDPMYQNLSISTVVVNIMDNDQAVLVVESAGSTDVSEAGTTDTYSLALSTQPTADVVITMTGDSQINATPSPVTFTTSNWNIPQTITVTAVDDLVAEGTHFGTISHIASSADASYDGIGIANFVAKITDNDTAGITVTPTSGLTTAEYGTTATFTVVLTSMPTSDVNIAIASSDLSEGTVSPSLLVFTPANALTPQTVTITGVNDPLDDGDILYSVLTNAASSSDPNYNGRDADNVSVTNIDDDAMAPNNTVVVSEVDHDKITWRLRGPGTLVFSQDDPDHNGIGPVNFLYVTGTDPKKSRLTLTVARAFGTGDGFTTIGAVTGSDLKSISASKANLNGSGVNIAGYLGRLTIRDILNGADVLALGAAEFRTTISARDIGDGTAIALGTRIGSLTAARFGEGTITAPSLGTLKIKGDTKALIAADFRGDVTLSGAGITSGKVVLSSVNVRGTVSGANFRVAGTVNTFRSGEFIDSLLFVGFDPTNTANPLAGGNFTTGLKLVSFTVSGLKGSLTPAFDNSYVAASTLGTVSLKSVDAANVGTYGVVAQSISRVTVRDSAFKLDPQLPTPQGDGSFQVWIV